MCSTADGVTSGRPAVCDLSQRKPGLGNFMDGSYRQVE